MVDAVGGKLKNVSFEDLIQALDEDRDFRDAILRHLSKDIRTSATTQPGANRVTIETKANFELDESRIFDLNGEGLKITVVAVN